ncbi:CUE domain-containing protein 1-like [Hypomesus transpacificus]|uniref:CUE domain-containing protein 1-like n=1 Tax=Hypomesus transpacificus TaxID=137520 RepID=UPI001F0718D6|nr:CUE domain-containing protein 1-like [Hypomesus transpacificus]
MMTSLFRRGSAGGGGHHGDVDHGGDRASPGELRPGRRVRRLEFRQAMEDFHSMFPSMEPQVIESVLRANHGAVDPTMEQLLQMSLDGHHSDDSSLSDDSIPPEVLERTLEPDSSDEEPPPVYSPPSYDMHIYDRKYPEHILPAPPPRFDAQAPSSQRPVSNYRNWNPPLLGNLPDNFLRILPQQQDSLSCSHSSLTQPSSSSSLSSVTQAAEPGVSMETEQERKLRWYLEDEHVALLLQNHEFMRELQHNRDFLIALERGDDRVSGSGEACTPASDEAVLFSDKLKHMGKSTRRKLLELVRAFSEKTRRRKVKRRDLMTQRPYPAGCSSVALDCGSRDCRLGTTTSTANLLADEEGPLNRDDSKIRRPATQEEEVPQQEVLSCKTLYADTKSGPEEAFSRHSGAV